METCIESKIWESSISNLEFFARKEDERDLHIPEEYWPFESSFDFLGTSFEAKLTQISERNVNKEPLKNEGEVNNLINELGTASFKLRNIESKANLAVQNLHLELLHCRCQLRVA